MVLLTVDEVIASLGGTTNAAKTLGRSAQVVSHWKTNKKFPPKTFHLITNKLKRDGFEVSKDCWSWEDDI